MISYNDPLQLSLLKLTSFNFQLEEIQNSLRNSSKNLNSSRSHSSFEIIEKIFDTQQNPSIFLNLYLRWKDKNLVANSSDGKDFLRICNTWKNSIRCFKGLHQHVPATLPFIALWSAKVQSRKQNAVSLVRAELARM